MKTKFAKRALSFVLTLGMLATLLPVTALAATEVTPNPSQNSDTKLNVEYFDSTLYSWDEAAANAATAEADYKSNGYASGNPTIAEVQSGSYYLDTDLTQKVTVESETIGEAGYTEESLKYLDICPNNNNNNNTLTDYYYLSNDTYYSVYYTCTGKKPKTYTLYYYNDKYIPIGTTNNGNDTVTLYTRSDSATTYYLTYNGEAVEEGTTYTSTSSTVNTTLYSASTDGSYEGKGFYFTASGRKPEDANIPNFSKWVDNAQNWKIYSGLAASKLSESGNAPFSDAVNAANLFADADNNYTSVYKNVKVPFIYDEETGYYELNSDKNAVYFENGTGASNAQMLIADLPAGYVGYSGTSTSVTGFAPFNGLSNTTMTGYTAGSSSTTTAYGINAASNTNYSSNGMKYGFGMVTTVNFQMTDNGKDANGNDITFEFAGDDDVWVYIDGTLALDIGGTHDAITGSINFATGDVILHSAEGYDSIGDLATDTVVDDSTGLSQTNLYTALGTTLTGFAASGNHTLTIYYMDRGQGRTNCLIKFNLPQRDSVSVTKNIAEKYSGIDETIPSDVMAVLNNIDFHFTAYKNEAIVPNKSYSIYDKENNLVGTGSTDDNGGFTLKNGQTATFKNISLDEEVSYYIVEDTSSLSNRWSTPSWTVTSTVADAAISGGNGATSGTVTVTGSETAADTVTFVCTNSYMYVSDLAVDANNDTIVIDYGLPVEIDVLHDDIISNGTFTALTVDKTKGTYGAMAVTEDNKLLYTLTKPLSGIETFTYTVTAQDSTDGSSVTDTATLTIIPATSVYYEENFGPVGEKLVTTKTNNAIFTTEDTSLTGYQETGFVGTTTDSTYGTDAVYLNNLGDSYGTSLKVDTTYGAAQYSYSFTGVGTTIYGRVSNVTGYIRVTVKNSAGDTVDTQYIDTINYVTVPEGESDQILDTTLYNIPIYQNTMLDNIQESSYGTYTVTIYVYKSGTLHETNNEFYLDGIRVFQPMGTSTEDNAGYAAANSAYAADGEQNVAVVNIREKIVADSEGEYADDVFTLTDVNGEIQNVEAYNDIGPNQELYLKDGYSGSFALVNWDSKSYKLYLGMKAPNGKSSEVTVGSGTFEITNSADCYYDISDYVEVETLDDGTVIGYVNIEGVSGLTALTNIKVTGVDEFNLAYSTDLDRDNEDDNVDTESTLYLVSKAYATGLTEEAEEEIPVFVPASITTSCSYASKTKKATVNVVTSKDVSYVTINGTKVTGKTVSGKLRFSKSYTKVISGTTYEIVAYNADGLASESYTVTAK